MIIVFKCITGSALSIYRHNTLILNLIMMQVKYDKPPLMVCNDRYYARILLAYKQFKSIDEKGGEQF